MDLDRRRVQFHVDYLKHGFTLKSDAFHLSFTSINAISPVALPVEVSAAALPENLKSIITLDVELDDD